MSGRILIETSQDRVASVARRWRKQYGDEPKVPKWAGVLKQLDALPLDATPETIEDIIGNKSWTREWCSVCGEYCDAWARLGGDDEEISICRPCLAEAWILLTNRVRPG